MHLIFNINDGGLICKHTDEVVVKSLNSEANCELLSCAGTIYVSGYKKYRPHPHKDADSVGTFEL